MLMPMVEPSGVGLCDRIGAEIAAGAGLVLDDEGAGGIFLLQAVGDQPRHDVGRRSCAERHNDAHGLARPILRR